MLSHTAMPAGEVAASNGTAAQICCCGAAFAPTQETSLRRRMSKLAALSFIN
jgi:hypothetical protein